MKIRKSYVLIGLVVFITPFAYYRSAKEVLLWTKQEDVLSKERFEENRVIGLKEVSAEVTYDTPSDYPDSLRFVVALDAEGAIQDIRTLDVETGEISEKKKEFNDQINIVLKGKKLSELSAIDKVGKSSLTTAAFNEALPKLQAAF
ncbi:MAG: hypothetical protein KBD65_00885 [Candidatus Moranbacteria bacterium]|nr:hypothetical protein [Candidatus Moranbacteria bacterium]